MKSLRFTSRLFSLTLVLTSLLLAGSTRVFAGDPPGWYSLIVRGGQGVTSTYQNGTLTVNVRKARIAAGEPAKYQRLPIGSAAWVDRPMNASEPVVLKQRMDARLANNVMDALSNRVRYWRFVCRSTDRGYIEVLRSEVATPSVKID